MRHIEHNDEPDQYIGWLILAYMLVLVYVLADIKTFIWRL